MADYNPFAVARKSGLNIPDWMVEGIDPALAASFLPGAGVYDSRQMGEQMAEQRKLNNYGTAALLGLGAAGMAASEFLPGILGASARKGIKSGVGLLPAPEPVLALPAPPPQMLLPPPAVVEQPIVPEVMPTYRSRLEPAIGAMPQEKMTAQQAQGHFAKFPGGVGADELEFTGVQGLLDQGQPVTKSGLLQQARSQKLEIDDVVLKSDSVEQKMNWGDPKIDTAYESYSHRAEDMAYDINNYGDSYYFNDVIDGMKKKSPDYDDVWAAGIRKHFKSGKQLEDLPGGVQQDIYDTLDGIAEVEYLDNPYVSVYDSETGYKIYGNDDVGYQINSSDGDPISTNEVYNLEEAKIQAYTDALDRGVLQYGGEGATRFENYALPGGENYQEMLLTLPNPQAQKINARIKVSGDQADDILTDMSSEGMERLDYGRSTLSDGSEVIDFTDFTPSNYENVKQIAKRYKAVPEITGVSGKFDSFTSSHFDETNILAHGRYNTRQIDGDKTLFIEEIQSDWHQKGRKQGYKPPGADERIAALRAEKEEILTSGKAEGNLVVAEELSRIINEINSLIKKAPDAPFKATEKWSGLTFDRMLKEAIDGGHDRIAWTPGQMQAERYGLRQQYNEISYKRLTDTEKRISGDVTEVMLSHVDTRGLPTGRDRPQYLGIDSNGVITNTYRDNSINPNNFLGKHITEFVGKDAGEKIVSGVAQNRTGLISDVDIQVGGEGMKTFYDKVVKKHATKLAKKHGSKVEIKDIGTGSGTEQVWSMKITPEMKKAMAGGVALSGAAVLPGLLQKRNQNQQPDGLLNF